MFGLLSDPAHSIDARFSHKLRLGLDFMVRHFGTPRLDQRIGRFKLFDQSLLDALKFF
jgi:hypothetical protein